MPHSRDDQPRYRRVGSKALKREIRHIMRNVAKTVARVQQRIQAETAHDYALYDARLELEVALDRLNWLLPTRRKQFPWIKVYCSPLDWRWYQVTDFRDKLCIDRWAVPMAKRFGIDVDVFNMPDHSRFQHLLGFYWGFYDRPECPLRLPPIRKDTDDEDEFSDAPSSPASSSSSASSAKPSGAPPPPPRSKAPPPGFEDAHPLASCSRAPPPPRRPKAPPPMDKAMAKPKPPAATAKLPPWLGPPLPPREHFPTGYKLEAERHCRDEVFSYLLPHDMSSRLRQ